MDLRCLARDGATLLGHVVAAADGKIRLDSDLAVLLARGDEWFEGFLTSADAYADKNGLSLSAGDLPIAPLPNPEEVASPILDLDLRASGISSVLWANGFDHDFRWIDLPVFGEAGIRRSKPKHMPWSFFRRSGLPKNTTSIPAISRAARSNGWRSPGRWR